MFEAVEIPLKRTNQSQKARKIPIWASLFVFDFTAFSFGCHLIGAVIAGW
jgi:hypothetical protein